MRTAVLGLDALPYWYIDKLKEWNQAPVLTGLLENAARLEAIPPITAASWPSIMSGVNPGKHGIFSFFMIDKATRERRLATALDLEHPRIHEMLSFNRIRNLMINPIPSYPLIPVRYADIVSNLFFTLEPLSSPHYLHNRYFYDVPFDKAPTDILGFTEQYVEAVERLIEDRDEYDLVWITLNFPDAAFHKFPRLLEDPSLTGSVWKRIDRLLRLLLDRYDNVFIVSDHGFRLFDYRVSINDILYRHGYARPSSVDRELTLVDAEARLQGEQTIRIKFPSVLYKLLARLGLEAHARRLYPYVEAIVKAVTGKKPVIRAGVPVDYDNSRAIMPEGGVYGVYIFDENIDPSEIAGILVKYNGLRVWEANEVYNGPYINRGPDVVVIGDHERGYALAPARIFGSIYIRTRYNNHDLWGVLAARTVDGIEDSIKGRTLANNVVAPLVMCIMGQPVPVHADSLDTVRSLCPHNVAMMDYTGKFRITKRLALSMATRAYAKRR